MTYPTKASNASTLVPLPAARLSSRKTTLVDLPTELLSHIISYIPESSAGCLAMCNHAMLQSLGQQYWRYLQADNPEKEAFLLLLQRDLPGWVYHPCCGRIREIGNEHERPGRRLKDSLRCLRRAGAIDISENFSIRFHHAHALMHRHRLISMAFPKGKVAIRRPKQTSDVADPNLITSKLTLRTSRKGFTVHCEPQILCRKGTPHQPRLFLSLTYNIRIPKTGISDRIAQNFMPICPHVDAISEAASIRCRLAQPHVPSCGYCGGLRNCEICLTDYEITSSYNSFIWSAFWPWPRRKPRGLTLKVQVWKDLGECKDIYSCEWWWATRKLYETDPRVPRFRPRLGSDGAGYVRDAFLRGVHGDDMEIHATKPNYWQRSRQHGWRPPR